MRGLTIVLGFLLLGLVGCGEPEGANLEKVEKQPEANLEKGAQAETISDWASANPKNGSPGESDK
ncbi:MAG: hypothetical protein KIT11_07720 [Fimbriimonadaceae bacterium]|nr:hypothetical protein [Fimbriimonadaceae bacterium]QYK56241.1 MAG: hypothetical protein KF733_01910 [Fimbriimonadaceae bacterium]